VYFLFWHETAQVRPGPLAKTPPEHNPGKGSIKTIQPQESVQNWRRFKAIHSGAKAQIKLQMSLYD